MSAYHFRPSREVAYLAERRGSIEEQISEIGSRRQIRHSQHRACLRLKLSIRIDSISLDAGRITQIQRARRAIQNSYAVTKICIGVRQILEVIGNGRCDLIFDACQVALIGLKSGKSN